MTENRLAPKGWGGGLAAMIPPGIRACAVRVNEVVGVAGFVVPGMRVDVLSGQPPGGNGFDGPKVRTLLQNIRVLSAGTNFQKDREGKPQQAQVVNLLASAAEAEVLSLASNETHIQLVLRNPMDTQVTGLPGTIMSDLFGRARAVESIPIDGPRLIRSIMRPASPPPAIAEPAAAPRVYIVEVSNGPTHTQTKFNARGKQ